MVFGMCPRCAARRAELEHRFQLAKLEIEKEKRLLALRKHSVATADIEIKKERKSLKLKREAAASAPAPVASEPPALITIKQANEQFGLSERYLRQLIREKKIASKNIRGKRLITTASLVAYRLKKDPERIS
jgi:excisionase family DNA binding protein